MIYKLTISGRLPGLNEYTKVNRTHRIAAAKLKNEIEANIGWFIAAQMKGVRIEKPVYITYTWYEENKKRDLDNIAFAKKFIQDALVRTGRLSNDGWKNITGFEDRFKVDKDNPRVEVLIEEVE